MNRNMNRILKTLFILLMLGLGGISAVKAQSAGDLPSVILEFRNQIEREVKEDKNKGSISLLIFKGREVIWSGAYGFADFSQNRKADPAHLYRTGSISKTFTAFLMLQLADKGIIKLTDPIEHYLPEIAKLEGYSDSTQITFHHLASHTSGLIREPGLPNAASGPIEQWEEKILASIPETSFQSGMDQAYSYSNIGYGILGLALSRAAGKPFMQLVEENIFRPLNMTHSFFVVPESNMASLAIGMESNGQGQAQMAAAREHSGRGYKVPNGGIYSTPEDLMKFMNAIMGYGGLLTEESRSAMVQAQTPEKNYGYGLTLFEDEELSTAGHGGSVAGYTCNMVFDQESQYGVILMRNYNRGGTNLSRASLDVIRKLKRL